MAQELRYGFMGEVDWAILEVCDIDEGADTCRAYLTAAGGISPTVARLAKHVILELNSFHSKDAKLLHDVYEPLDPPLRQPIPITHVNDRIGTPYVEIDAKKIVGVPLIPNSLIRRSLTSNVVWHLAGSLISLPFNMKSSKA